MALNGSRLQLFGIVPGAGVKDLAKSLGGLGVKSHRRFIEITRGYGRWFEMPVTVMAPHQGRTIPIADDLFCFRRHEMKR